MEEMTNRMGLLPGMPVDMGELPLQGQCIPNSPDPRGCACMMSREALMKQIHETSFAMDDAALFLDTHPDCREALQFYREVTRARKNAMDVYERQFGPLMLENVTADTWNWVTEKWPWEGGV